MNKTFWLSGQRVIKQVLDWFQDGIDDSILDRHDDLMDLGVIKNLLNEFDIIIGTNNTPTTPSVTIRTGVAYDVNGSRVSIENESVSFNAANATHTTDDGTGTFVLTPRSTGSLNVPLTVNTNNYVWIDYLQTTDDSVFTLHRLLNNKIFYRQTDGYAISVTLTNVAPSVTALKLGNIDLTAGGVVSSTTINKTGRAVGGVSHYRVKIHTVLADKSDRTTLYTPDLEIFADDHVRAIGTGNVSANNPHGLSPTDIGLSPASTIQDHQEFFHSNGIIASEASTTSALFGFVTIVTPGFDFLTYKALTGTERVNIAGNVTVSSDISADVIVNFTALDPSGTWYIYEDGTSKTIQKTQTNLIAAPDITKLLLSTVTYTYPGGMGAGDGDLSAFVDQRKFGTISSKDIQNLSITSEKIDPSVAGNGLSGGGGSPLSVNVSTGIIITGDTLELNPTVAGNGLSFTSGVIDVLVDNSTLQITSDTLSVKASGITSAQIATSVAGNGLSGGGGSPLAVNVDGSTLQITSDTLSVAPNGITGTQLNASVAGNGLAGGGGSPLSVNAGTGLEISSDAIRIATSAAGNGLSGGGGSPLAVNVDGTTIQITGDVLNATTFLYPLKYKIATGTTFQATSVNGSFGTVFSYTGVGALKALGWLTNNPGSGGATFTARVILDGNVFDISGLNTGVNAGQGFPTVRSYSHGSGGITGTNPFALASGVGNWSTFFQGFTSSLVVQIRADSFSDGRWAFTPYISYEATS